MIPASLDYPRRGSVRRRVGLRCNPIPTFGGDQHASVLQDVVPSPALRVSDRALKVKRRWVRNFLVFVPTPLVPQPIGPASELGWIDRIGTRRNSRRPVRSRPQLPLLHGLQSNLPYNLSRIGERQHHGNQMDTSVPALPIYHRFFLGVPAMVWPVVYLRISRLE